MLLLSVWFGSFLPVLLRLGPLVWERNGNQRVDIACKWTIANKRRYSASHPDRLSMTAAARTARLGLMFGLAYGGVQDLVGLARGRPIGYVDFIKRRSGRTAASHKDALDSQPAV